MSNAEHESAYFFAHIIGCLGNKNNSFIFNPPILGNVFSSLNRAKPSRLFFCPYNFCDSASVPVCDRPAKKCHEWTYRARRFWALLFWSSVWTPLRLLLAIGLQFKTFRYILHASQNRKKLVPLKRLQINTCYVNVDFFPAWLMDQWVFVRFSPACIWHKPSQRNAPIDYTSYLCDPEFYTFSNSWTNERHLYTFGNRNFTVSAFS